MKADKMESPEDFNLHFRIDEAKRYCKVNKTRTKSEIINDDLLMKELGLGNKARGKKRFNQLLQRKLYWLDELDDAELYVLLLSGYVKSNSRSKDKKLVVRNEKGLFENVICLLPKNENMQHMRDKEFVANLDRRKAKIEWLVSATKKRIDVVFKLNGKIGVEIQNSALEYRRLEEKIRSLNCNFDKWFFIVPKKFVERYSHLNTQYGKITDMKEAIKEIKAILKKVK